MQPSPIQPSSLSLVDCTTQKSCWIKVNEHSDNILLKHCAVVYIKEI